MKKFLIIFVSLLFTFSAFAQLQNADTLVFSFASQQSREQIYKSYVDTSIKMYLADPLADSTEGEWNEAFWSIEFVLYKNDFVKQKLSTAWKKAAGLSEYFQRNLIEVCYAVYPKTFKTQALILLKQTKSIPVFIRDAEYMVQADSSVATRKLIRSLMNSKFKNVTDNGLFILKTRLETWNKKETLPPLKDLLNKNFLPEQTVIYSFQRKSRAYPGLVVVRKPDGSFVRNADSSIFQTSQLARAVTNFPYYITNGNTPQGILRWLGFGNSKLKFIGPTTNLQLWLPVEAKPSIFFGDSSLMNINWEKEMYASMLPASWKNYEGIYESFYAGSMGRSEIIMHGTTIDPQFYKGQTYYPQTPSLGCLCSYEEWDKDGRRVISNQQKIVDALNSIAATNGYVVVINLDDKHKPVTIDDIKNYLQ